MGSWQIVVLAVAGWRLCEWVGGVLVAHPLRTVKNCLGGGKYDGVIGSLRAGSSSADKPTGSAPDMRAIAMSIKTPFFIASSFCACSCVIRFASDLRFGGPLRTCAAIHLSQR